MNYLIKTYLELHLYELKYNIFIFLIIFLYLFLISYFFSNQLIYLFSKILIKTNTFKYFIFTNITEIFLTKIFISFTVSFFISIQCFLIQVWFFLKNGLYQHENLKILKFYITFILFNFLIIKIIFIKIIPNLWFFFINNNFSNQFIFHIYFEPQLNHYFNFIFYSFIYIYILFIYFFLFFYIMFNNLFNIKIIVNLRKFFYIKFLIIATIISPPDIYNQLILTFIFISIFEIILFFLIIFNKYK